MSSVGRGRGARPAPAGAILSEVKNPSGVQEFPDEPLRARGHQADPSAGRRDRPRRRSTPARQRRRGDRRARGRGVRVRATSPAPSTSRAATWSPGSRTRWPTATRTSSCTAPRASARRWPPTRWSSCSGYSNVESMTGGITLWKDRGYEVEVPRALSREQRERYSRHLLIPEVGTEGQQKLLDVQGAAAGRRRPGLAGGAVPGGGRRGHAGDRRQRRGRPVQPPAPGDPHHRPRRRAQGRLGRADDRRHQPRRRRRQVPGAPGRLQHHGDHRGLRRDRRRPGQLPHPLPAQRRLGAAAHPGGVGGHPGLRRPAVGVRPLRGAVLPLPVPRASAGRAGALLRGQRRAGRAPRNDGPAAGHRGDQAGDRPGRSADRAPAAVRRPGRRPSRP